MTSDQSHPLLRFNVLGPLEIIREPGGHVVTLPTSVRACTLLALFALKDTYERSELVSILWPDDVQRYGDSATRGSIDGNLDTALYQARQAVGLSAEAGFLYAHQRVVSRVRGETIEVTSDVEEFGQQTDLNADNDPRDALALVRGEIAAHLRTDRQIKLEWLELARTRQSKDITTVLQRLHLTATEKELESLCQDVLDGRYPKSPAMFSPTQPAQPSKDEVTTDGKPAAAGQRASSPDLGGSKPARLTRKRFLLVTTIISIVGFGAIGWAALSSSNGNSIPPAGAIVNTWTGRWTTHMPKRKAESIELGGPQIVDGPNLQACDRSAGLPCAFSVKAVSITAHMGDVIELRQRLYDPMDIPIPYVKVAIRTLLTFPWVM